MPIENINLAAGELLPHRNGMLLMDEALSGDENSLTGRAIVKSDNLFARNDRIGNWVLIEYMAQTMAMWISWRAKKMGLPPPVGFLLGTRKFQCTVSDIAVGSELICKTSRIFLSENEGIAQFQCEVEIDGEVIARAAVNAFEPKNIESFLTGR